MANKIRPRRDIRVSQLLLDVENPRLFSGVSGTSENELVKFLWTEMAVSELVISIAENGYWEEEPIFVIKKNSVDDIDDPNTKFIVIEGNRRLAAIKILRDSRLRDRLKIKNVPKITEARRRELSKIPAYVYPSRRDLWAFLGFRHINSPQSWDAFSKAKFVSDIHDKYKIAVDDIALKIGDEHSTVERYIRGFRIYKQAEEKGLFDINDISKNKFYFSHLYTATSSPEFQKFLGILSKKAETKNPVPKSKFKNLDKLMLWLYGKKSENIDPLVKTQNPDLNKLREIVGDQKALNALNAGRITLQRAYEISMGDETRFSEALAQSEEDLREAKSTVTNGYKGDDYLMELIVDIRELVISIKKEMEDIDLKVGN